MVTAMPQVRQSSTGTTGVNKLVAHAFGVRLVSDVPERLCRWGIAPRLDAKRRERLSRIRERGVLFVHVPKNAGTSVSHMLYGTQVKHATARYYAKVAPGMLDLPSFAVVRDPVERFLSAFAYARTGGTCDRIVSEPFRGRYEAFRDVDCAIAHLQRARSPFHLDHIFRPQAWYLQGPDGALAVDRLVPYDRLDEIADMPGLERLGGIPRLNTSKRRACGLSERQEAFVRDFYAADCDLFARARAG